MPVPHDWKPQEHCPVEDDVQECAGRTICVVLALTHAKTILVKEKQFLCKTSAKEWFC